MLRRKARRRSNSEGSLSQRKDSLWEARITLPGGRRRSFYARTKAEALKKIQAAQRQIAEGRPLTPERMTVRSWLEQWLRDIHPEVAKGCFGDPLRQQALQLAWNDGAGRPFLGGWRVGPGAYACLPPTGARTGVSQWPSPGQTLRSGYVSARLLAVWEEFGKRPSEDSEGLEWYLALAAGQGDKARELYELAVKAQQIPPAPFNKLDQYETLGVLKIVGGR